jgi:macrodomain Ter protein organizer (MatP/YcbG family)
MAREKYKITKDDSATAFKWIENKLAKYNGFPSGDFEVRFEAGEKFPKIKITDFEELNTWCEKWMNSKEWKQLKNTLRAARKRRMTKLDDRKKSVDLTAKAHFMLSQIAKRDGLTLSETIVKYLRVEMEKHWP